MKDIIQRSNIGCVIGHDYAIGEDQKILTKAKYIIDPWVNDRNVFYWGIDLQSNYGVLIAEHLQKRQLSTVGYWKNLKIIVVLPSREWVTGSTNKERLEKIIKKADKTVYLGTDKPEEVWKHLIKQSGHMLTYFSNPFHTMKDAIKEAFTDNIEVGNCSSYRITNFKHEVQLKAKGNWNDDEDVPFE